MNFKKLPSQGKNNQTNKKFIQHKKQANIPVYNTSIPND